MARLNRDAGRMNDLHNVVRVKLDQVIAAKNAVIYEQIEQIKREQLPLAEAIFRKIYAIPKNAAVRVTEYDQRGIRIGFALPRRKNGDSLFECTAQMACPPAIAKKLTALNRRLINGYYNGGDLQRKVERVAADLYLLGDAEMGSAIDAAIKAMLK